MVRLRQYDPRDSDAVWHLHEWAMSEAGTDPADIPDTDDLRSIEESYLTGGDFVVGVDGSEDSDPKRVLETFDGSLVAMGGFVPSENSHDDERTVSGAASLHRMRVAPPVQGEGYGRQLLAELEARIVDRGFRRVLATTANRQRRAVTLYRAAGYRVADRSTHAGYELLHFEKAVGGDTDHSSSH